jgi:transposase
LQHYSCGNAENPLAYLKWLRAIYQGKNLLGLWDGATSQRDPKLKEFLAEVNTGREEKDWLVTLLLFAPNAPEQNPREDLWLAGKNHWRRQFAKNKTFAQVKESFGSFLKTFFLKSIKFHWDAPQLQII